MRAAASLPGSLGATYFRRRPEDTTPYAAIQRALPTWLSERDARETHGGGALPRFVRRELESFLKCGRLEHGFARLRCGDCGTDRLVALTCKGRGFPLRRRSPTSPTPSPRGCDASSCGVASGKTTSTGAASRWTTRPPWPTSTTRPFAGSPPADRSWAVPSTARGRASLSSRGAPFRDGGRPDHGIDLHACVVVGAKRRDRLEALCRYVLRPPVSDDRLEALPDRRYRLRLKTAWRDGTSHLLLSGHELVNRLAALVPAPRKNRVVYHGVLSARSSWRSAIVPRTPAPSAAPTSPLPRRNPTWAELLRRGLDISGLCPVPRQGRSPCTQEAPLPQRGLRPRGPADVAPLAIYFGVAPPGQRGGTTSWVPSKKHGDDVIGSLSGFDRMVLRGRYRALSYTDGLLSLLASFGVLLKDFGAYVEGISTKLKASVRARSATTSSGYCRRCSVDRDGLPPSPSPPRPTSSTRWAVRCCASCWSTSTSTQAASTEERSRAATRARSVASALISSISSTADAPTPPCQLRLNPCVPFASHRSVAVRSCRLVGG